MPIIQWSDNLSVGIAEIDRQHQRLVAMINELHDAMRQGKGKDALAKIINGLITYTVTHFQAEEKYFDQYGYPDAAAHKAEHAAFKQKVGEFKAGFESGKIGLSMQVNEFLSKWLQNHINNVDKKYGPFLNAKGLK